MKICICSCGLVVGAGWGCGNLSVEYLTIHIETERSVLKKMEKCSTNYNHFSIIFILLFLYSLIDSDVVLLF